MYQVGNNVSINENEITQLIRVDGKCFVILSSGEKVLISQEQFDELKERG